MPSLTRNVLKCPHYDARFKNMPLTSVCMVAHFFHPCFYVFVAQLQTWNQSIVALEILEVTIYLMLSID